MKAIDRRGLLRGSVSVIGLRALPRAFLTPGPLLLLTTQQAQAWVQVAIAVAATVAGMVAAHNRGDGGVGAMLSANYELLKVAISKLDDIQTRLADIYKRLEQLPDEVDRLLKQENTRRLQTELLAVIRGYSEKLKNRDPSLTDTQWRSDPNTTRDIANLLFRLEKARQEVNVQNLLDPATALVATSLGFVETNLKNILGFRRYEIVGTVTNIYIPWFDMILDPSKSDSTIGYTAAASKRLENHMKSASENQIGKGLGMKPGNALLACTGVNDYKPQENRPDRVICTPSEAVSIEPQPGESKLAEVSSHFTLTRSGELLSLEEAAALTGLSPKELGDIEKLVKNPDLLANTDIEIARNCETTYRIISGRTGPRDRLAIDVTLKEVELVVDGKPTGLLTYELIKNEERRALAGHPSIPPDGQCEVQTHDIADANARLNHMRGIPRRAGAETAFQDLSRLIELINLERSRIAFGSQAMVATEIAKQNLSELVRRYS
jgi:hypothetical protein